MSLRIKLANTATLGGFLGLLAIALFLTLLGVPLLIALGLRLVGIPLDWSSWHTYAGLIILSFVAG